ncbi:MAG: tetratricopeptide repeat protein [bacterium]|nr:tetratricopeptide repeat protein [bacterium]
MEHQDFSSLARKGREALESGRNEEAVGAFKGAINLKPNNAWAYYNLGSACLNLGRHEEAIAALKEAIRLKPGYYEAKQNLEVAEELLKQEKKHDKPPFWFNVLLYCVVAVICLLILTKIIAPMK